MTLEEIQLRRLAGQHLLTPTDTQTVVKDLCGVQAQFLSHALHGLSIPCTEVKTDGLVKSWTNRGAMHLFSADDLPLFLPKEHMRDIFNLAGIVRPAILVNGTVVGWWNLKNRKLKITLFSPADQNLIDHTATALWSGLKQIEYL